MTRLIPKSPVKTGHKKLQKRLTYVLRPDQALQVQRLRQKEREEQHSQEMQKMRQMLVTYDEHMHYSNTWRTVLAQIRKINKLNILFQNERESHKQEILRVQGIESELRQELQDNVEKYQILQEKCTHLETIGSNTIKKNEQLEGKVSELEVQINEKENMLQRFQTLSENVQDGSGDREELQKTKTKYGSTKDCNQSQAEDSCTVLVKTLEKQIELLQKNISELEFQALENRSTLQKFQTELKQRLEEAGGKEELQRTNEKYKVMEKQYAQLQTAAADLMERAKRNKKKIEYLENKIHELEFQVVERRNNTTLQLHCDFEKLQEENVYLRENLRSETKKNVLLRVKFQYLKEKLEKRLDNTWKVAEPRKEENSVLPKTKNYFILNMGSLQDTFLGFETHKSLPLLEKLDEEEKTDDRRSDSSAQPQEVSGRTIKQLKEETVGSSPWRRSISCSPNILTVKVSLEILVCLLLVLLRVKDDSLCPSSMRRSLKRL